MASSAFYSALARSITAGEAAEDAICVRLSKTLGRNWRWLRPLARRYRAWFGSEMRPRRKAVVRFLRADDGLAGAIRRHPNEIGIASWLIEPASMQPVSAAATWQIPSIGSVGALSDWLAISPAELEWFGDRKRLCARKTLRADGPLAHYHYRILAKDSRNIRLIEAPKARLKQIQQQILSGILHGIPVHPAAHGFVKTRSIQTFVTPHAAKRVVLRMDLRDFFPSIHGPRIPALFRMAGYPESVADLLGALCSNSTPRSIWATLGKGIDIQRMAEARTLYAWNHLPQGAPTSPALANICFWRADCRLTGLAQAIGAIYTRYADDLAFSGDHDFERCAGRFAAHTAAILLEEGFAVQHRKTRLMRQGVRQHLAGLVVNQRPNVVRADFDRLKATLTNCLRHGPASQNREAHPEFRSHLQGRIAFIRSVNPARGAKLTEIFNRIRW